MFPKLPQADPRPRRPADEPGRPSGTSWRKRIIAPVAALIVFFIVAFVLPGRTQACLLVKAAAVGRSPSSVRRNAAKAGMVAAGGKAGGLLGWISAPIACCWSTNGSADPARLLHSFELGESTMLSMSVSFRRRHRASPSRSSIYQLWMFVAVGLKQQERLLGFLFIPAGVIFFYLGGNRRLFFVGLPYFLSPG